MDQTYQGELIRINITNLIKFSDSFAGVEVYLPVGAKFVRLNYSTDQFIEILRGIQQREVSEVYLKPEVCSQILLKIQEAMSSHTFYDPKTIDEKKVETVDKAMSLIKSVINQIGIDVETVRLLKTMNARSMALISESPTLYFFVQKFRKNCSDEFMRTTLTSYVMYLMIDKFNWKSELLKEKGALASMLCDLVMEKSDFEEYRASQKSGDPFPERLRNHPLEVAQKLRARKNLIPTETITIIEQHHELPDGKGFPLGISGNRFNQLSCIFILSQQFIELLFQENFNYNKRLDILTKLRTVYACKSFEKSLDALTSVVA
jgi:hypothetical protein